jgi:hypothetical protein
MPDFLEEFASSISGKKETLKEKMLKGKPNPLYASFEKNFKNHWVTIDDMGKFSVNPNELSVMAVDSSVYTNSLSTGGIFYVIRSLAVCRDKEQKCLETDTFFTKAGSLESQRFVGRKMEMLEFQAAINALESGFECGSILVDGSLYGRASHLPIETEIEDQELALLYYFQTYRELFDLCRKRRILLIGVSKESRSDFYRNYLLKLIFEEALDSLAQEIDPADLQKLKPIFTEILFREQTALHKFAKIRGRYGKKLDTVKLVLDELRSCRPDYQLIMNHAKTVGYTEPLLVGPSERMALRLEQYRKDPARYVRSHFRAAVREKGKDFISWASEILSSIMGFPSIVSLHLLLDVRDSPIRIDMPCWDYAFARTGWPKPVDFTVEELLKVMVTGYCGLDCYNLWLSNVDKRVRLKKSVVDTVYFPFMERLFDAKIIRGRSYRRVRYP